MRMRVGLVLRNSGPRGPESVRRITQLAADFGYDAVWASDHILGTEALAGQYDAEWLDPFVSLAVAAERAPHLTVGFSLIVVPYRPALPTARTIATLQDLTGG